MPFIERNEEGTIIAVYDIQFGDDCEEMAANDPELLDFLGFGEDGERAPDEQWIQSDLSISRVIEDLVDVLIEKNVITFSDLPPSAQKKLVARRGLRKELDYVSSLFPIDEGNDFL